VWQGGSKHSWRLLQSQSLLRNDNGYSESNVISPISMPPGGLGESRNDKDFGESHVISDFNAAQRLRRISQ
jgi:hypothetical protein